MVCPTKALDTMMPATAWVLPVPVEMPVEDRLRIVLPVTFALPPVEEIPFNTLAVDVPVVLKLAIVLFKIDMLVDVELDAMPTRILLVEFVILPAVVVLPIMLPLIR